MLGNVLFSGYVFLEGCRFDFSGREDGRGVVDVEVEGGRANDTPRFLRGF